MRTSVVSILLLSMFAGQALAQEEPRPQEELRPLDQSREDISQLRSDIIGISAQVQKLVTSDQMEQLSDGVQQQLATTQKAIQTSTATQDQIQQLKRDVTENGSALETNHRQHGIHVK